MKQQSLAEYEELMHQRRTLDIARQELRRAAHSDGLEGECGNLIFTRVIDSDGMAEHFEYFNRQGTLVAVWFIGEIDGGTAYGSLPTCDHVATRRYHVLGEGPSPEAAEPRDPRVVLAPDGGVAHYTMPYLLRDGERCPPALIKVGAGCMQPCRSRSDCSGAECLKLVEPAVTVCDVPNHVPQP
jgi:hypothetical protein